MSPGLSLPPAGPDRRRARTAPSQALVRTLAGLVLAASCSAQAASDTRPTNPPPITADAATLPAEVSAALRRAKIPESALMAMVQEVGNGPRLLAWNEQQAGNPASVFKLLTTYAALDQLGPAWSWSTAVGATGPVQGGVLDGSLVIRGSGDPKLVVERLWLLLRRVQQLGVREIRGDILLDRSAFALPDANPAGFDGKADRPYNVKPDALLLNYKSVTLTLVPDAARGVARVGVEPALAGWAVDATVPLTDGPCSDWRNGLKASTDDPSRLRLAGKYPLSCGELSWPLAYADPASYNARLVSQLWRELGGTLSGSVREAPAPAGWRPLFEQTSPALADVVRDINKFSNNVMAEQLFLSTALARREAGATAAPVRPEDAREALRRWLQAKLGEDALRGTVIDNGSGLSRNTRISALTLNRLLQSAWASPVMPELMSSLPVSGLDGTMRRSAVAAGRAHLKTGSLDEVSAVAGYVLSADGHRQVVVALINHPAAGAGRPALDALVQWVQQSGASANAALSSTMPNTPTTPALVPTPGPTQTARRNDK